MQKRAITLTLLVFSSLAPAQNTRGADPLAYLISAIEDEQKFAPTMMALRATGDKELLPIVRACANSGDKKRRLFAASSAAEIDPQQAPAILLERLQSDPSMTIRSEALAHLTELNAIKSDQLLAAAKMEDESIQCIAARALVQQGKSDAILGTLAKLCDSKDLATSCMSRMSMLSLGRTNYLQPLLAVARDSKTPEEVLALMLDQIAEQKITQAQPIAQAIIDSQFADPLRVRAFTALLAISPQAGRTIADVIAKSNDTVMCIRLLWALAKNEDAPKYLTTLAVRKDVVGSLAGFELNRRQNPAAAAVSAVAAIKAGHPVVLDYLLEAMRKDFQDKPEQATAFVPALTEMITSVSPDANQMQSEHIRAANAARLLCDIGSVDAEHTLSAITNGRYNAIVRSVATGIYKSSNGSLACKLARGLIKSPYEELATDAALTLGKFADPAAADFLDNIVAHPLKSPQPLVVLACWYSLKIQKQTTQAANELAKHVK